MCCNEINNAHAILIKKRLKIKKHRRYLYIPIFDFHLRSGLVFQQYFHTRIRILSFFFLQFHCDNSLQYDIVSFICLFDKKLLKKDNKHF